MKILFWVFFVFVSLKSCEYNGLGVRRTDIILVRYDELALKSKKVRARYEQILVKNIKAMLNADGSSYSEVSKEMGRIFIHSEDANALKSAAKVFGAVSASPAYTCEPTLESAAELCADVAGGIIKEGQFFAIRARRAEIGRAHV